MSRILVIGGTGRTGRQIVEALTRIGDSVRVLTRQSQPEGFEKSVDFVEGSITRIHDVETAVQDVDGVVIIVESANSDGDCNSPEQVHYQGMLNVLNAVSGQSTHIVLVTQIYITRPERLPEVKNIIYWRGEAEKSLRSSTCPYTIVRPSWLVNDSLQKSGLRFEQGDRGEGEVAREAVAEVCSQALHEPSSRSKTFEIYSDSGTQTTQWSDAFSTLHVD